MYYLTMGQDEMSFRVSSSGEPNNPQVNEAIKALLPPEWTQVLEKQTTQIRALIQARSMHLAKCKNDFAVFQANIEQTHPEILI